MARKISADTIRKVVSELFKEACVLLPADVEASLCENARLEKSEMGKSVFARILENIEIARNESIPLCQDTGAAIVFVEIGQEVCVVDGNLNEAIQQGVREAYRDGFLRKSICSPISRQNTLDNTPAFVHYDVVAGDKIKITAMPKGGGAENASLIKMLTPSDGLEGVIRLVISHISEVGRNACPPLIVGIGIGATLDTVGTLAKKALLRPLGSQNPDTFFAETESELLEAINVLGIGAGGYGGSVSALAVHILAMPCHIASLPVAINVQCHSARHKEALL